MQGSFIGRSGIEIDPNLNTPSIAIQSGGLTSGLIGSGQLSTYHLASGAFISFAGGTAAFYSGTRWTAVTTELISGVRAVSLTQSGYIQMAMASVSGRGPAFGIVIDNVASGIVANVYTELNYQSVASGIFNFSGFLGQPLYLGRSGQIAPLSGWFSSGGFSSGDVIQDIGTVLNSGAATFAFGSPFIANPGITVTPSPYGILLANASGAGGTGVSSGSVQSGSIASGAVQGFFGSVRNIASGTVGVFDLGSGAIIAGTVGSGAVQSGNIASGSVGTNAISSGTVVTDASFLLATTVNTLELISGLRAVSISSSGYLQMAMASVSGRPPSLGVVVDNVSSGQSAKIYTQGFFQAATAGSGQLVDFSGFLGQAVYAGRSGQIVQLSGSWNSGGFSSGDVIQNIGYIVNSGGFVLETAQTIIGRSGIQVDPNPNGVTVAIQSGGITSGLISSGTVLKFQFSMVDMMLFASYF